MDFFWVPSITSFWPKTQIWKEHPDIGEGIKGQKSIDGIKSMIILKSDLLLFRFFKSNT